MGFKAEKTGRFTINEALRPPHQWVAMGFDAREVGEPLTRFVA